MWANNLELMAQSTAFLIHPLELLALCHKLRLLRVCIPRKSFLLSRKTLCGGALGGC